MKRNKNKSKNISLVLPIAGLICFFLTQFEPASGQAVTSSLSSYFTSVRQGNYPAIPKHVVLPENAKAALKDVMPYTTDTLSAVRSKAYAVINAIGSNSRISDIRQHAVKELIEACKDAESGNVGQSLDYLTTYLKDDFNGAAKDSVSALFIRKISHLDKLIKIIGFLELNDMRDELRPYTLPGNTKQLRWASLIALARMGDPLAVQDVMTRVKKLPVNDDLVYQVFPDLVYTRHREPIQYLVQVLYSEQKNCYTPNPENPEPMVCGYRVMEQLVPAIEGYPLSLDQSGDIKTKDYPEALATVRRWFEKHKDFQISKEKF